MNTQRYENCKDILKKTVTLVCKFQKYGLTSDNQGRSICLVDIKYNGKEIIDHIWLSSQELIDAKLRTRQGITISATISTRKRAPDSIFDDPKLDIKLKDIKLISKAKIHKTKLKD